MNLSFIVSASFFASSIIFKLSDEKYTCGVSFETLGSSFIKFCRSSLNKFPPSFKEQKSSYIPEFSESALARFAIESSICKGSKNVFLFVLTSV